MIQEQEKNIKFKRKIYTILFILNMLIVASYMTLNYLTDRFINHHKNITISLVDIKYYMTESHLWLEEYINGDKKELEKISEYLEYSHEAIEILKDGGYVRGIKYMPMYNDKYISQKIQEAEALLYELNTFNKKRINEQQDLSRFDELYDLKYTDFIRTVQNLEKYIHNKFTKMYSRYMSVKKITYILIILILISGIYLIFHMNREIKEKTMQSLIDPLTKVGNRESYQLEITKLLKTYRRYKTKFVMILFDIDNFKEVNDTYGHRVGDVVLLELSTCITRNIRENIDSLFRIGGEEFIVLCPNTELSRGKEVAEKLRVKIEKELTIIKNKTITVSVGVTEVTSDDTEDSMFKRADQFLYKSKINGKNQVTAG